MGCQIIVKRKLTQLRRRSLGDVLDSQVSDNHGEVTGAHHTWGVGSQFLAAQDCPDLAHLPSGGREGNGRISLC